MVATDIDSLRAEFSEMRGTLDATRTELDNTRKRLDDVTSTNEKVADEIRQLDDRIAHMGREFANQIHELGTGIDNLEKHAESVSAEALAELHSVQARLAAEQVRYEIAFRQDLTELGGLGSRMPATALAFLVGSAGLVGLLPLGCFWCYGLIVHNLIDSAPQFAAVFLLTNLLTAANVVRVFRAVFLGQPMPKTRRAPEVIFWMALPMVSLAVIVLLLPLIMQRIDPVPGIAAFPWPIGLAVAGSGLAGVIVGCLLPQDRFWSRSRQPTLRVIQDLLAYDFYTPVIYRATIVRLVAGLAQATRWFDLNVVKGVVDGVGRLSLATAEGLKLSVSGQLQSYVLTLIVAIVLLLGALQWLRLGF
mgnify:CR=1 FL=1